MKSTTGFFIALTLAIFSFTTVSAQDEIRGQGPLEEKLEEYLRAIERESIEEKCRESDFLISSCTDSAVRQFTALKLYSHYISSNVMGDEAVAISVFDKWFKTREIKMKSEIDLLNARMFAEFNRRSLIGEKAPDLIMEDLRGEEVSLFCGEAPERLSILYFYDTDCAKCKVESILLQELLTKKDYPVDFYAIYTQADRAKWEEFAVTRFPDDSPGRTTVTHLWDPEISSDFQMKYAVLQTPRLFLVSEDGVIIGRNLDSRALETLLKLRLERPDQFAELSYGSEGSGQFYKTLIDRTPHNCSDLARIPAHIEERTLQNGDTLLFRQMTGDLLYYLGSLRGEENKCALDSLIANAIYKKPEIWKTAGDSLKIIAFADILHDLHSRAAVGTKLPEIRIEGVMKKGGKTRKTTVSLDRLKGFTIIFHTDGCLVCKEELAKAETLARESRKNRFFIINTDEILTYKPETAKLLYDNFDLTVLPYITETDKKGKVKRKYMSIL